MTGDAAEYITNCDQKFDLIFADTWAGKFTHLSETLELLNIGGLYVIDDLLPQPAWPDGHAPKIPVLLNTLAGCEFREGIEMDWDTGLALYVRTKF